jgi:hypothetical protein
LVCTLANLYFSFSPDGRRVVINYNSDHAYVFNVGLESGFVQFWASQTEC